MRLTNQILEFSKEKQLDDLFAKFADYYNHHKAENLGANVSFDRNISFSDKTKKLHKDIEDVVAKITGIQNVGFSSAVMQTNPVHIWATFAVVNAMIDAVIPDVLNQSAMARYADIRYGGFGDTFSFDIRPNELFIVTKAGNGKRHTFAQRQHNGEATLIPENRMITVEEDLYRVLAGKRNLAEYAIKVAISLEEGIADEVYNAVNDTYGSLPGAFKEAAFTQDAFVGLAQRIKAFNSGMRVATFGTQLALSKVLPDLGSDIHLDIGSGLGADYTTNGYLGRVLGVDLFEMPQKADWKDADYGLKLPDDRLHLISTGSDKLVKVAIEGDIISYTKDATDQANLTIKQTLHKKYAVGLISSAHYGIIDLA